MSHKRQSNKAYKVYVKYEAKKASISIPPDHSIHQLKAMISSHFNLKPEEQSMLCNGKPLCAADNITLKKAQIPNGSKMIVHRVPLPAGKNSNIGESAVIVDETFKKLENIVKNASEVIKSVHSLEKERRRLQNEEDLPTQGYPAAEYKRLKLECGKNGEELMCREIMLNLFREH
jgi:hypothetical protein